MFTEALSFYEQSSNKSKIFSYYLPFSKSEEIISQTRRI